MGSWVEMLPGNELRWAIHHMAWYGTEPEPLVRALLTSARLPEVADEASACFFNTLGMVTGSLAHVLEGELARARSWQVSLDGTSAAAWALELVEGYVATVEWERRREEEREIWFR